MKTNLLAALPERYTRFVQLPNGNGHNAVWDFQKSPDDRWYISVCGENEKPLTALLYEYYPDTGALRLIFDVANIWIVDPEQMPPSKIHTSIDFMPDGKLIMATHNTAPAPGHKQWMYEQHYEHPWQGYPGSILMIVDPDTNEAQVKGIPVPRESIYGGMLGNDPRYYYFLGYMRGHFYRLDLETNEVKDYGKVSEFSSCRLVKDAKGRLYGSSYTGELWRYDPERDAIEDLKVRFESPNGTKYRRQFIFALHTPRNTLLLADNTDGEMIELDPETLEVTRHGHIHLPEQQPEKPYLIGGLAADNDFIVYYGLKTYDEDLPIRLVRWDILRGGKPENLGLIAPQGKASPYICEMIFDRDGWLHMVDVCGEFSPYVLAVDAGKLEPPGVDAPAADFKPYIEPDWNLVGSAAFMHIEAQTVRTLPLHRHMAWKNTAVHHMRAIDGTLYCISGMDNVYLTISDYTSEAPISSEVVYADGAPVSCVDLGELEIAVLTSDGRIVFVDLQKRTCRQSALLPVGAELARVHVALGGDGGEALLASGKDGVLAVWESVSGELRRLDGIRLHEVEDAAVIRLDERHILLSGSNDDIVVYDLAASKGETLAIKAPSIRGRAFRAAITGGVVLADGTVVAGTSDGMLFSLSADLRRMTSYGRLYASGQLRQFVRLTDDEAVGVYGGRRDAGHVFHFSSERGLTDLGRPRVIKDNGELANLDTEWASIHYISCLAYDSAADCLSVASGELYGCVVRYTGMGRVPEKR